MSKERLEEIKNCYKDDLEIAEYAGVCLTKDDYLYLINQSERVQELETIIDFYQSALRDADRRVQELENHIDHLYDNNVHLKGDYRLQEQNKRYREAIEKALYESAWGDEGNALAKMISILGEALRGE